jgi:hypothetical protein
MNSANIAAAMFRFFQLNIIDLTRIGTIKSRQKDSNGNAQLCGHEVAPPFRLVPNPADIDLYHAQVPNPADIDLYYAQQ